MTPPAVADGVIGAACWSQGLGLSMFSFEA